MDKARTKDVYRAHGLPVAESRIVSKAQASAAHVLPPPYVIKPNNEGSSVGVYLLAEGANAPPQLSDAMPAQVMVEAYLAGRELTC